jgi:hypothetical protein
MRTPLLRISSRKSAAAPSNPPTGEHPDGMKTQINKGTVAGLQTATNRLP